MLVAAALEGGYDDDGGVAPPPTPPSGKRKRPALSSARPQSQHQKLLKLHAATAKSNEQVLKQLQSLAAGDQSVLFGLAAKAAAGKDVSGAGRANGLRPQREHKPEGAIPCSFFAAGKCTYGNKCKFVHGGTVATADGKYEEWEQREASSHLSSSTAVYQVGLRVIHGETPAAGGVFRAFRRLSLSQPVGSSSAAGQRPRPPLKRSSDVVCSEVAAAAMQTRQPVGVCVLNNTDGNVYSAQNSLPVTAAESSSYPPPHKRRHISAVTEIVTETNSEGERELGPRTSQTEIFRLGRLTQGSEARTATDKRLPVVKASKREFDRGSAVFSLGRVKL